MGRARRETGSWRVVILFAPEGSRREAGARPLPVLLPVLSHPPPSSLPLLDKVDALLNRLVQLGQQRVEAHAHRAEILATKRHASDLKGRDRLHAVVPEIDVLIARWVAAGRNIGSMVGRTIHLLNLYGETLLGEAVAELVARGTHDPGALAILCEQRRRAADKPVPIDIRLGDHVPDRDVIPHDLGGYDAR